VQRNTNSWHARKGDLQCATPLDVPMVPSSSIANTADDECLACGGLCLSEPIRLGNFEFITNYFSSLSLSPKRGNEGSIFVGSTHSGLSLAAFHDRGLHRGGPHSVKQGRKLCPPFPQIAQHGGPICPHYKCNMEGERSSHDKVSPTDGGGAVGD
jgi:hypothetical protein